MSRHDGDCEADWGSEGQESPCRCNERRLAVNAVLNAAQRFSDETGLFLDVDGEWSYRLADPKPLTDAVEHLNEVFGHEEQYPDLAGEALTQEQYLKGE